MRYVLLLIVMSGVMLVACTPGANNVPATGTSGTTSKCNAGAKYADVVLVDYYSDT